MILKTMLIFIVVFVSSGLTAAVSATSESTGLSVDNGVYAELLQRHTRDGVVDYQGFKSEEARLDRYLEILAAVDPAELTRDEQFAFYANAYNAWTIKLILSGYPGVKSIKDLGTLFKSPWKKKISRLDGQVVALDYIEHEILRPRFKDPRVHFAINCAAKSCPPLSPEPFEGRVLDQQLDQMTTRFINDAQSNYLKGDTLYVSSIFKWFKEDFRGGVVPFFLKYAQGELKTGLEARKDRVKVKYLDYDWSLNGS